MFVNADSGEQYIQVDGNEGDRKNLTLWQNGENLITAVANSNKNTIVVAHSVGAAIMESWIDHPNITAVCFDFFCHLTLIDETHVGLNLRLFGLVFQAKKRVILLLMSCMATSTHQVVFPIPLPNSFPITLRS